MQQLIASMPYLAFLLPIIALWGQIKDLFVKLIRLLIVEVKIDGDASKALTYYLAANAKSLPTNVLRYDTQYEYVIKNKRISLILMQILAGLKSQLFWYQGTVISLSDLRGKDKETEMMNEIGCSIRFVRGTLEHETLLLNATKWYEELNQRDDTQKLSSNFRLTRLVGTGGSTNDMVLKMAAERTARETSVNSTPPSARTYESLRHNRLVNYQRHELGYAKRDFYYVFNETTQRVKDDVTRWWKSKEWYQSKGLLFRRGALLYGPAGSGKTAVIRKTAQELDMPLFLFELNTMSDGEFINFWDTAINNGPCIVVFEDIDTIFKLRENIAKSSKLSFECVLNCISGVIPAEGIYLFVTTNRLDYLDPALGIPNTRGISTRPGRLDTCFEIGNITEEQKIQIVSHFLSEHPDEGKRLIEESNGCTAAQFNDMCSQKALELHWGNT